MSLNAIRVNDSPRYYRPIQNRSVVQEFKDYSHKSDLLKISAEVNIDSRVPGAFGRSAKDLCM
jgi:hypothetical protein